MSLQAETAKPACPECGPSTHVYPALFGEYDTKWACNGCDRGIEEPEARV